jgi:hypothetical protein
MAAALRIAIGGGIGSCGVIGWLSGGVSNISWRESQRRKLTTYSEAEMAWRGEN